jgi:hypothetical protein
MAMDDIKDITPPPDQPPPQNPVRREIGPESETRGGRESIPQESEDEG